MTRERPVEADFFVNGLNLQSQQDLICDVCLFRRHCFTSVGKFGLIIEIRLAKRNMLASVAVFPKYNFLRVCRFNQCDSEKFPNLF